ncbi:hypothetical protein ABKN59_011513 [Abortiporus biennis]
MSIFADKPRLVDDLIPQIINANTHTEPSKRQSDLARFCLVSTLWLPLARKRLYEHPTLRNFVLCRLFATSLSCSTRLPSLVKGIDIHPIEYSSDIHGLVSLEEGRACREFSGFLVHLQSLQNLSLGGDLFNIRVSLFFGTPVPLHRLSTLKINGSHGRNHLHFHQYFNQGSYFIWDDRVLQSLPNLRVLHLTNITLRIDTNASSCSFPPVEELSLRKILVVEGELSYLLWDSWDTVHTFTIDELAPIEAGMCLEDVIQRCTNLRMFQYEVGDFQYCRSELFNSNTIPLTVEHPIYTLHTLILVDVDCIQIENISRLFPGLQKLVVSGWSTFPAADQWARCLLQGKFSELNEIGLKMDKIQGEDYIYAMLHEACSERNINFHVDILP